MKTIEAFKTSVNKFLVEHPMSLRRSHTLQMRALSAQVGMPTDWSIDEIVSRFARQCSAYNDAKYWSAIRHMVMGKSVSDETMLEAFEAYCEVELSMLKKKAA